MSTLTFSKQTPEYYPPNDQYAEILRKEAVASIAELTLRDMAELDSYEENDTQICDFTIQSPGMDQPVRVLRSSCVPRVNPSGVKFAPRGGSRLYQERPDVNPLSEVSDLGRGMSLKYWLNQRVLSKLGVIDLSTEIPIGGKTEIVTPIDPRLLIPEHKAELLSRVVNGLIEHGIFGEFNHKTGPDVNMTEKDMVTMRDALMRSGYTWAEASTMITGLPVADGGIAGRAEATARGGAVVFATYLEKLGVEPGTDVRFSLQGYGNAGSPLVDQFNDVSEYNGILSCVSDETGGVYCKDGLDTKLFKELLFENINGKRVYRGIIRAATDYAKIVKDSEVVIRTRQEDPDFWLKVEADCYVPAAMARGINEDNIHHLIKRSNELNGKGSLYINVLANHGVSSLAQIAAERAGIRTSHFAHTSSYGVVGSLAQSAKNSGMLPEVNASDPAFLNGLIVDVASEVTANIYDTSIDQAIDLKRAISLPMVVEAVRYQALARLYGRPNYAQ